MKKIISTLFLAAVCSTCFAQLKVNAAGNILIGDSVQIAYSKMGISNAGGNSRIGIRIQSKQNGMIIDNDNNMGAGEGLRVINRLRNTNIRTSGIYSHTNQDSITNGQYMGVWSMGARTSRVSTGVMGTLIAPSQQPAGMTGAGVYGYSGLSYIPLGIDGIYAGFFNGDVKVTGTLYGTLLTPSGSSSGGGQGTVISANTDRMGESVSEKLGRVQLLQFLRPTKEEMQARQKAEIDAMDLLSDEQTEGLSDEEVQELRKEIEASKEPVPQTELASTRYGLAADQLKAVYPELVYEDKDGNVSINYMEMIPLLVQALNEQQVKINEQQARIDALEGKSEPARKPKAAGVEAEDADILAMSQNVPNPFTESTEIQLNIPASVKTAAVFFYDMTGKQVDKRIITERGATTLSVSGTDLTEGMYLYSLIADGKMISTKKMILTK